MINFEVILMVAGEKTCYFKPYIVKATNKAQQVVSASLERMPLQYILLSSSKYLFVCLFFHIRHFRLVFFKKNIYVRFYNFSGHVKIIFHMSTFKEKQRHVMK